MMVIEAGPGEFYLLGSGLSVTFLRDPDVDNRIAGIASIEEGSYADGKWVTRHRLNWDQSDQGRELFMDPHAFHVYLVQLYTYGRENLNP